MFVKRKLAIAALKKQQDLLFISVTLASEIAEIEKKLENISYQMEFFGSSSELQTEKKDCEIMLKWLHGQIDEVKTDLLAFPPLMVSE